jgi:hypothetical protein
LQSSEAEQDSVEEMVEKYENVIREKEASKPKNVASC